MKTIKTLVILMFTYTSFGQALFDWERSFCIVDHLEFCESSGQYDQSGNSFYAGTFDTVIDFDPGIGVFNLTPTGAYSGILLKLDIDGNFIYATQFGTTYGTGTVEIRGFDMNANGEMIISGVFNGTVDFDPSPNTYNLSSTNPFGEGFILKIDANGNLLWAYREFDAIEIHLDDDGEIFVLTEVAANTPSDLDPTSNVQSFTNTRLAEVIIKLDSNGGYEWHKYFQSNSSNPNANTMNLHSICADSLGNSYCLADVFETNYFDPTGINYQFNPLVVSSSGYGKLIFKLSDQGDLLCEHLFVDSIKAGFTDIVVGPDMNLNVIGSLLGIVDMDFGAGTAFFESRIWSFWGQVHGYDFFVGKYSSDGDLLWGGTFGREANDNAGGAKITVDSSSNCFVTSRYLLDALFFDIDPGPDTVEFEHFAFGGACFVLKLDSAGLFQWAKTSDSDPVGLGLFINEVIPANISVLGNKILTTGNFGGAVDFDIEENSIYLDSCTLGNIDAPFMWQFEECDIPVTIDSVVSCNNYTWIDGNIYFADTDSARYVIETIGECDSVHRLILSIIDSPVGIDSVTSCGPYTWFNGVTYAISMNSPQVIIPQGAANGCDSIVNLHLTVTPFDTSVIQNGVTLTATQSGVQYQWLDCDNNYTPISGETNQSFTASMNGNYAMEISNGSCVDTSSCYTVTSVGLNESVNQHHINLFPNPSYNLIHIESDIEIESVSIIDLEGNMVFETVKHDFSIRALASGMYLVRISTEQGVTVKRFIKD